MRTSSLVALSTPITADAARGIALRKLPPSISAKVNSCF